MIFSHSRVECYTSCPYKFKLRYIEGLKTKFNLDPSNPLILGQTAHLSIQTDIRTAIRWYYEQYPSLTYLHILEMEKLLTIIPGVVQFLPKGSDMRHEVELLDKDFKGYIDTLIEVAPHCWVMLDYKYTNNKDGYMESDQLHVYKYLFEKLNPGEIIVGMYFVFIPKVNNPMFFKGTAEELKENIREKLTKMKFKKEDILVEIKYNPNKVIEYLTNTKHILEATEYPKNVQKNCQWCEYKKYCQSNGTNKIEIMEE